MWSGAGVLDPKTGAVADLGHWKAQAAICPSLAIGRDVALVMGGLGIIGFVTLVPLRKHAAAK